MANTVANDAAPAAEPLATEALDFRALKDSVSEMEAAVQAVEVSGAGQTSWWSTQNAMTISASVLIFGAVVMALAAFTTRGDRSQANALRLYGTLLVIIMATFLVVAGYSDKQISAPLGLLGTIAGYLLGREEASRQKAAHPATDAQDSASS